MASMPPFFFARTLRFTMSSGVSPEGKRKAWSPPIMLLHAAQRSLFPPAGVQSRSLLSCRSLAQDQMLHKLPPFTMLSLRNVVREEASGNFEPLQVDPKATSENCNHGVRPPPMFSRRTLHPTPQTRHTQAPTTTPRQYSSAQLQFLSPAKFSHKYFHTGWGLHTLLLVVDKLPGTAVESRHTKKGNSRWEGC